MAARTKPRERNQRSPIEMANAARYAVLLLITVIVMTPLVVALVGGFRTNQQLLANPISIPNEIVLSNYSDVLTRSSFWRQVLNSVTVMLLTTVIALSLASSAAFVLSRLKFRGREPLFNFITLGLLFPLPVAILPLYILLRQLNLVDSLWGVILPQVAFGLPLNVLLLRSFFLSVPRDLEDAAYVDGAGPFEFLIRILLPLVRPALAAVAVITMVTSWNNFFLPLVVLNSENLWTLPLGVTQFQGQYVTDWARVLAFVTLALVPAVGFYLVAERQLVAGLTSGAVKG
ncbi:MAG TPA: carbohydrate ABC transporter permease [Thermomicrobiales bacterium]|nr:carbohydrate ABC transporter permease [Thermomicrobiales bacterium]